MTDIRLIPLQPLTDPRGTRFILPPRPRNPVAGSIAITIFGLIFAGFACFWMATASGIFDAHRHPNAVSLIFSLFGIPFVLVGLGLTGLGIFSFFPTHSEILITVDTLLDIEHYGPFKFTFQRRLAEITRLHVTERKFPTNSKPSSAQFAQQSLQAAKKSPSFVITVEGIFKKPLYLASGYPRELLIPLAQQLAAQLPALARATLLDPTKHESPAVTIDPPPVESPAPQEETPLPQPPNSKIIFIPPSIPRDKNLTFAIPHPGLKSPLASLVFFAVIWLAFVSVITVMIFVLHAADHHGRVIAKPLGLLILTPFWAAGIGMFLIGIQMMFRKSVLLVSPDAIVFSQKGPIRKSEKLIPTANLSAIRVGSSSVEVNHQPVPQLQFHLRTGTHFGILTGTNPDDLEWIASTLRTTLHLPDTIQAN